MQQSQSNIITVQNLSKLIYKAKGWFKKETEVILHPISFSVLSNEFVLILMLIVSYYRLETRFEALYCPIMNDYGDVIAIA